MTLVNLEPPVYWGKRAIFGPWPGWYWVHHYLIMFRSFYQKAYNFLKVLAICRGHILVLGVHDILPSKIAAVQFWSWNCGRLEKKKWYYMIANIGSLAWTLMFSQNKNKSVLTYSLQTTNKNIRLLVAFTKLSTNEGSFLFHLSNQKYHNVLAGLRIK